MTITVIFDEAANPLYILTVIYSLCLIVYSGSITLKNYIRTSKKSSLILLIGIMIYVLSYSNLIYISVMHNPYQTLGHSMIYLILIQGIFHLIMAYLIISNFAYNFLLAQTEESKLESIIEDRTNELKKSYNALLKQDNIRRQMIMDISHDLKSPVTIIKGYLELLVTNKIKDENREEYLNIAYKKTSYMSDLISELFTLFNLEIDNSFSREKENLNDLITDICSGRTNVKVDIPKDLELYCSEKHFRRLINNLIENSLTHGGNKCLINISTIRENSDLTLIFSDDGIGIHPEIMPYIFNRFKRGDKSRHENEKHFGLGLSICKAIVEKHNGTIECESIFGKGATFKINLKGAIE
jgi:signal transduction histidine kinase